MINGKSISLCMVIYGQAELTKKAIESVNGIIDEVVIVDQGSDKQDSALLRLLADIYYYVTNKGNADYDRQYCYSLATKDYILALDADEIISLENLKKIELGMAYDFDVMWFLFENKITHNGKEIDLQKFLGEDPHPRLWRRVIKLEGQDSLPIIWPQEAHRFPKILSQKVVFCDAHFTHNRDLRNVIITHLRRSKNITQDARDLEKNFIRTILNEFGLGVKKKMTKEFPELMEYLK